MNEVPDTWLEVTLADVGQITTGTTPSTKDPSLYGGHTPFVKPGHLDQRTPITHTEQMLSAKGVEQSRLLRAGAVLVSCIGNLGKVGVAGGPVVTNQQINSIEFEPSLVDDRYGAFYCRTLKPWMEQEASATTIAILNKGRFSTAPFVLAPLAEQKRIADKLEAVLGRVDACRARLDRVPDLLKRFRQSVLAAATSGQLTEDWRNCDGSPLKELDQSNEDRGEWGCEVIPNSWAWEEFDQVFDDETDSKRKLKQSDYEPESEGRHPVVDQGERLIGGYSSKAELLSEAKPPLVVFGDHTRCVKWVDSKFIQGADGVKVLVPRISKVLARFAYFALLGCRLPDKGYSRHMKFLKATKFPIPPLAEQTEIVRRVEALFALADRIEARLSAARAQVERLTPATLSKAFRGDLVPQDPNDEPASALLERLASNRFNSPEEPRSASQRQKKASHAGVFQP